MTIVNTGSNASFKSGSKTFDGKATVTFSDRVSNDDDDWGWYSIKTATLTVTAAEGYTITAAEGYTITRVEFYCNGDSASDSTPPSRPAFDLPMLMVIPLRLTATGLVNGA